ncbi:MAG: hypothetical protein E4G95_05420 [Bacteroidia bacterium]|nr:MAG: hypothetical protein E4G95_05420 [Bacteroidia bacterium]
MERLKADNQVILKEAREERDLLMKEARTSRDRLIAEARNQAKTEAEKIIEKARVGIEREKATAIADFRNQVASLSVEIAEKILRGKLKDREVQDKLVSDLLDEVDLSKN